MIVSKYVQRVCGSGLITVVSVSTWFGLGLSWSLLTSSVGWLRFFDTLLLMSLVVLGWLLTWQATGRNLFMRDFVPNCLRWLGLQLAIRLPRIRFARARVWLVGLGWVAADIDWGRWVHVFVGWYRARPQAEVTWFATGSAGNTITGLINPVKLYLFRCATRGELSTTEMNGYLEKLRTSVGN